MNFNKKKWVVINIMVLFLFLIILTTNVLAYTVSYCKMNSRGCVTQFFEGCSTKNKIDASCHYAGQGELNFCSGTTYTNVYCTKTLGGYCKLGTLERNSPKCGGTPSCFLPSTQITLPDYSTKNIEDVQVGEYILSYDEETEQNIPAEVTQTFIHEDTDFYLIINDKLKVTSNHPVLLNNEWQEIGNAKVGDILQLQDGTDLIIDLIEEVNEVSTVYNLEVEDTHTYYAEGVLVHNKPATGSCDGYSNGYYDAPNCRRCRDGVWWFPDYSNNMPYCCPKFGCEPGCCAYVASCCGKKSSCFPAGIQITLPDYSTKNIEDIEVNDYVLSYDFKNNKLETAKVLELESPIREGYYEINDILNVTDEHPFYTMKKNGEIAWSAIDDTKAEEDLIGSELEGIDVYELEIGDKLYTSNGEWIEIEKIRYVEGEIKTYNLKTVDKYNVFFANDILVHNKDDVIDEVIDDGCDEEGQPCGTCNSGRYDSNCNCVGDGCTYSPGCSPTAEYRCLNGKLERRTRSTLCCGGCSGWSGWSVADDCPSHDAWCRNNACVDCDTDADICSQCAGQEFYSGLYSSSNNLRCCRNTNVASSLWANEWPMDITVQWGGIACCDQSNDCPISNTDCVNNFDSDYTIPRMETDTICIDANLMSRTKLVSLQLLTIAKNKASSRYVLFCDEKNTSLNYIQKENAEINNTNNICVLSLKDSNGNDQQIMIGASLNPNSNLLSLISSISVCANVENKNEFQACNAEKTIYYNPIAHAVIFSTQEITNVETPVWTVALTEFLTDLINRILGTSFGQNADISYINQREERYTNLYVNRIGDKVIRAVKEPRIKSGSEVEVIIADYEGFTGNICTGEQEGTGERGKGDHNKRFGVTDANYNCTATDTGYQMFLQNNTFSDKWSDITAKLRPK